MSEEKKAFKDKLDLVLDYVINEISKTDNDTQEDFLQELYYAVKMYTEEPEEDSEEEKEFVDYETENEN